MSVTTEKQNFSEELIASTELSQFTGATALRKKAFEDFKSIAFHYQKYMLEISQARGDTRAVIDQARALGRRQAAQISQTEAHRGRRRRVVVEGRFVDACMADS